MKKYLFGALILIFALGSCVNPKKLADQIEVMSLSGIEVNGTNGMTLSFEIDNQSNRNIRLMNGELAVGDGRRTLARINAGDVLIRKRSLETVSVPLKVSYSQLALLALMGRKSETDALTVSGTIKVRSGVAAKTFTIEDVPLKDFLDRLGLDDEILSKTMKIK